MQDQEEYENSFFKEAADKTSTKDHAIIGLWSLLIFFCFLIALQPQVAKSWVTAQDDPDVFGNVKVLVSHTELAETLIIVCNQRSLLKIGLLYPYSGKVEEAPATLLVRLSPDTVLRLPAVLKRWNLKYAGVVASGRDASNITVIRHLEKTTQRIQVGASANGAELSASFTSRGSTPALSLVKSVCKV